MGLLDALLPIAAGWAGGANRRRDADRETSERKSREAMEERRLKLAEEGAARAAQFAANDDTREGELHAARLNDLGFDDRNIVLQRVQATLKQLAATGANGTGSVAVPLLAGGLSKFKSVDGVGDRVLDTTRTPAAIKARTEAAAAAARATESEAARDARLEEIRLREELVRGRPRTPSAPRAEPQGTIRPGADGFLYRVLNGKATLIRDENDEPVKAPPTGGGGRGGAGGVGALIDQLRGGRTPATGAPPASGDTAINPAMGTVPPATTPTPAQAARYRELRAQGMPPEQARAEALKVR